MEQTKTYRDYVPSDVILYFVNYDDNLDDHVELLQECLENNSYDRLNEEVYDWWYDPEGEYMSEIAKQMCADGLSDEYYGHLDEISELLRERDCSDPVSDLLNNTNYMSCYYSLGYQVDGWHEAFMAAPWRNTTIKSEVANIRRKLGIKKGSEDDEKITSMVNEASYGGDLRIYFKGNLQDMVTNSTQDFKTIHFKGRFAIAIYDSLNGSGDIEYFDLDRVFPFVRENLAFSESDRYSLENCFGICADWLSGLAIPEFKATGYTKRIIKTSNGSKERNKEREYIKVYKAGGCTCGDTAFCRHRGVFYRNELPCGWVCPHCGQFWID